jgi:DHA3 family macrolide efflux protein-like MFS transporter
VFGKNAVQKRVGFAQALQNRNFRALWLGQLISQVGDSFAILAVLVAINELTKSSLALGLMVVSVTLPQLLFGLIAGVFVDRFDRKVTMIASDIARGLAILALFTVHTADRIVIFFIVGFVMGTVGVFFNPARNAALPNIVGEELLLPANALTQTSQVMATVFGPALAGLFIGWFSPAFAFVFDSLTFFASAAAIATMSVPCPNAKTEKASARVLWDQLREGLAFIKGHKTILNVLITAAVAMLGLGAITVLAVRFLDEELGIGPTGLGFLNSVQGIGMVAGGVLVGNFAAHLRANRIVGGGMIVLGLALASLSVAPNFTLVLIAAFVIGLCMVSARTVLATMTQALVPDEKRGRVESALNTLITVATMTSMGLAGLLGDPLGVRLVFFLAGLITAVAGGMAIFTLRQPQEITTEVPAS